MQEKLKEQQEAVLKLEVVGEAGAGLVSVRMNGKRDVLAVHIDDSVYGEDKGLAGFAQGRDERSQPKARKADASQNGRDDGRLSPGR